jgi:hypothetical protein
VQQGGGGEEKGANSITSHAGPAKRKTVRPRLPVTPWLTRGARVASATWENESATNPGVRIVVT